MQMQNKPTGAAKPSSDKIRAENHGSQADCADNEILVTAHNHHQRLDNFLLLVCKNRNKSNVYKLIREGQVRVNKSRAKAMQKLRAGDIVRVPPFLIDELKEYIHSAKQPGRHLDIPDITIDVIYEDDWLLAVNKPHNLAVHSGSGHAFGLIDVLRSQSQKKHDGQQKSRRRADQLTLPFLELIHRLDKDTSGCLLLAKDREVLVEMQKLFNADASQKRIAKQYLALLTGDLKQKVIKEDSLQKSLLKGGERMVSLQQQEADAGGDAIASDSDDKAVKKFSNNKAKEAISHFTPDEKYKLSDALLRQNDLHSDALSNAQRLLTLAKVNIETGRTHQIRVQSAEMGLPVAGDNKYGDKDVNRVLKKLGLKRMFLHAKTVSFIHPKTNKKIRINAPLEKSLQNFLDNIQ